MAFEKALIRQKADLIYFVGPSFLMLPLQKLNYLSTVWDLCHRDTPEFPEVRHFSEFHVRESLFQKTLAPSVLIITDSAMSKENISRRYGIDQDRILSIPFSPSPLLEERYAAGTPEVLARYRIESGYFFYPAQFWSHKNHMRILDALLILQREDWRPVMVFTGGDMGNRKTVEEFIMHNGLTDQVKILGFIPPEDMRGLYSGARAVVMPSYFGPTNLPPLEAWIMGKPLIYSTTGREQAGDAAILFDPDEAKELANALKLTRDDQLCADLIEKGRKRLQEIEVCRNIGEEKLLDRLIQFEKRCRCWGGGKE